MGSDLRKITQKELMEMYIRTTRLYLEALEECDGEDDRPSLRFDFSNLDLSGLDFHDMYIPNSHFDKSNLKDTCFSFCTITYSSFIHVNMEKSSFRFCDLSGSNFAFANMKNVDVSDSNFSGCEFGSADMDGLYNIENTRFDNSYLENAINPPALRMACPSTGSFYGYKKCRNGKIVTLLIPDDAKRSSATGRKCRCDKAKVVNIEFANTNYTCEKAISSHDCNFVYRVGETVTTDFCEERYIECAPGIHFFLDKQDAINY